MIETGPQELATIAARAQAHADVFKLPLQRHIWRGQTGDFQGGGVGSSLDFQDHRAYAPGDDPRHINWQAYARTGNYTMKLFREEVRPLIDVVLDVSDSMSFDREKWERAVELFYFSIHAALKSGAAARAMLVKGDEYRALPDEAIHGHAWTDPAGAMPDTPSAATPELRALPFRAQSMRILISDLLCTGSPEAMLRSLNRAKGRGVILAPFLIEEERPDWQGNYEFIDSESGDRHPHRIEPDLMKRYRAAYQRHFGMWKTLGRKFDVLIARVPAGGEFQGALQYEAVSCGAVEIWT